VLLISTRLVFIPLGPNSTMHRVASVRVQEGLRIFLLWSSFCCTKRENSMAFLYSDGCHTVGRAFCGLIVDLLNSRLLFSVQHCQNRTTRLAVSIEQEIPRIFLLWIPLVAQERKFWVADLVVGGGGHTSGRVLVVL